MKKMKKLIACAMVVALVYTVGWQFGKHSVPAAGVWVGIDPKARRVIGIQNNSSAVVYDFNFEMQWVDGEAAHWTIVLKTVE